MENVIIIIILVARILDKFKENKYVKWAFYGLRAIVIALIAYAAWGVYKIALLSGTTIKIPETVIFLIFTLLMIKFKKVTPTLWILIAAILGIILKMPTIA